MASSDYTRWKNAGKPYTLMRPAKALQRILRAHGLVVYDYPNDAHLLANTPEDHTPFSATGWPNVSAFGIGHALDVMPRADTAAGRAENAAIARLLINARNAGIPGVMWIKYLNWTDENGNCRQESWKPTHASRTSTDKGHIHISGRSDCDNDQRADNYDPLGEAVSTSEWHTGETSGPGLTQGTPGYAGQQRDTALAFAWQAAVEAKAEATAAKTAAQAAKTAAEAAQAQAAANGSTLSEIRALLAAQTPGAPIVLPIDGTYRITKVDETP